MYIKRAKADNDQKALNKFRIHQIRSRSAAILSVNPSTSATKGHSWQRKRGVSWATITAPLDLTNNPLVNGAGR